MYIGLEAEQRAKGSRQSSIVKRGKAFTALCVSPASNAKQLHNYRKTITSTLAVDDVHTLDGGCTGVYTPMYTPVHKYQGPPAGFARNDSPCISLNFI